MFTIIGLMLTGMLVGYLLRNQNLSKIHQVITLLIWVLLFILGIEVGGNEQIIKGLHTIGLEAIVLTLAGTFGSLIAAWLLWKALYPQGAENARTEGMPQHASQEEQAAAGNALKGSLVIVGFFALGALVGITGLLPFDITQTNISFYALAALV